MILSPEMEKAASVLRKAETSSKTCPPIRNIIGEMDLSSAYSIQTFNMSQRMKIEGSKIIGRKIGLTSTIVQKQLGVNQPDFGTLLDSMQVFNGAEISMKQLMQPKVEAEIAFILKEDLQQLPKGDKELLATIDYAVAAIEIVGSRIENWNIRITDTIADNASASHFVLGDNQKKPEEINLINCKMKLYKNNEVKSEGNGAACLGSPLNAFRWLAKKMIDMGSPLKKADIVLTGALGPMLEVEGGDFCKAEIDGFGSVEIHFSK